MTEESCLDKSTEYLRLGIYEETYLHVKHIVAYVWHQFRGIVFKGFRSVEM
jgi:hypothetical protein